MPAVRGEAAAPPPRQPVARLPGHVPIAAHQLAVGDAQLQLQLAQLAEQGQHREGDDDRDG